MSRADQLTKKKADLLKKLEAIKVEENSINAAEREKARKEENRVKLLLGAGLIAAAKSMQGQAFTPVPTTITGSVLLNIATAYLTGKDRDFVLGSKTWERLGQR